MYGLPYLPRRMPCTRDFITFAFVFCNPPIRLPAWYGIRFLSPLRGLPIFLLLPT